jgi:hypothetical protein
VGEPRNRSLRFRRYPVGQNSRSRVSCCRHCKRWADDDYRKWPRQLSAFGPRTWRRWLGRKYRNEANSSARSQMTSFRQIEANAAMRGLSSSSASWCVAPTPAPGRASSTKREIGARRCLRHHHRSTVRPLHASCVGWPIFCAFARPTLHVRISSYPP